LYYLLDSFPVSLFPVFNLIFLIILFFIFPYLL
jgi:hypothetical protein